MPAQLDKQIAPGAKVKGGIEGEDFTIRILHDGRDNRKIRAREGDRVRKGIFPYPDFAPNIATSAGIYRPHFGNHLHYD
jgi:hypothetical protein